MTAETFYKFYKMIIDNDNYTDKGKIKLLHKLDGIRWQESDHRTFTKRDNEELNTYLNFLLIEKVE